MSDNTTLIDNLNSIKNSKADIKQALIDKGQQATDVLDTYAGLIEDIETGIDTSDATATASDIKEGKTAYVDGEKITGIYVDEDLTDVLDAQDQKIAELEQSLENKTAGGDNIKFNIYAQLTEPTYKDGVWLETDKELNNIVIDDSVISGLYWNNSGLPSIPYVYFHGLTVAKGTDVYLFGTYGNSSSPGSKNLYKYNTLTNTYTKLSDMPYKYNSGTGALIGDYVYIFGANNANFKIAYKYDTLNDTYTQISNVPYTCWDSDCAVYGNDIYLFGGGGDSTQRKYAYKYNILTDTYTRLTDIPYNFYAGSVAIVGKNIYLFGSEISGYARYTYKYDVLTDTYTRLTDIPYDFYRGAVQAIEDKIYLFGTNASAGRQNAYEYNTITNTYIKLGDIPNTFNKNNAVAIKNKDIYLFGGEFHPTLVQRLSFIQKQYENNSIIILSIEANKECNIISSGIKNLKVKFSNVYYYTTSDGLDNTIPIYYGDGTKWIKFKN